MSALQVVACRYADEPSAQADRRALDELHTRTHETLDVVLFGADDNDPAPAEAITGADDLERGPAATTLRTIRDGTAAGASQPVRDLVATATHGLLVVVDETLVERVDLLTPGATERERCPLPRDGHTTGESSSRAQSGWAGWTAPGPAGGRRTTIRLDPRSVWQSGLIVIGLVLLFALGMFLLEDGGSVIFQVVMAWLASIAMEPAVSWLARRMPRGLATGLVMVGVAVFFVGFFAAFGQLLVQQVSGLATALPGAVESAVTWANATFDLSLDPRTLLERLNISPGQIATVGAEVAGGVIGVVAQLVGGIFSLFTISLFIFYFSADAPRLKRWVAGLLPPARQQVFVVVWDLAVKKTGGYVAARLVLAAINGATTALFLLIIGMDNWLALGIWTGVVAQFVPTIGTYIAIALPVLVGLTSPEPVDGVLALAFALVYQQIENLTIEPRISADAVDMHPAVAFGSVLLGASLFGVAGALVAVPVAAMLLALFQIYSRTYQVLPQLAGAAPEASAPAPRRRWWSR